MKSKQAKLEQLAGEQVARQYHPAEANQGQRIISAEAEQQLLQIEGVEGVGQAEERGVAVFISDRRARNALPDQVEGHPVVTHESGRIKAL